MQNIFTLHGIFTNKVFRKIKLQVDVENTLLIKKKVVKFWFLNNITQTMVCYRSRRLYRSPLNSFPHQQEVIFYTRLKQLGSFVSLFLSLHFPSREWVLYPSYFFVCTTRTAQYELATQSSLYATWRQNTFFWLRHLQGLIVIPVRSTFLITKLANAPAALTWIAIITVNGLFCRDFLWVFREESHLCKNGVPILEVLSMLLNKRDIQNRLKEVFKYRCQHF